MPSVAVIGGSLGGLTAALVLRDAGADVRVFERSRVPLEARGVGIASLAPTLRYAIERLGIQPGEISIHTDWVRYLHSDGTTAYEEPRVNVFSAWNTLYRVLRGALPDERYLLGKELTHYTAGQHQVEVRFADGDRRTVDLVVGADGINSTARAQMFPEVRPTYAGYIAWRGTVLESDLSGHAHECLHDALTYQVLRSSHVLVYPIPDVDGRVTPGHRLLNVVWYRNVREADLPAFLTDRAGTPRRVSVPPGHVRAELIDELRAAAVRELAPQIAEVVTGVLEPFVQAIYDTQVPRMSTGRVALVGDAAFAVRPHAAAATAKAAEDGWALAEELVAADGDVAVALAAWEVRQRRLGEGLVARTRAIGDRSQARNDFRPGDPSLIFGLHGPGQ
jgi:2,6-dihydroxypyridine 3-monooxygenase